MANAPIDSAVFAKALLVCAKSRDLPVSNLQLQKLAYYCQGYALALLDHEMFLGQIEAWSLGPVVPSIYHDYKRFGADVIAINDEADILQEVSQMFLDIIQFVLDKFGRAGVWSLVHKTHQEAPWKAHYNSNTQASDGKEITHAEMRDFFCQEVSSMQDNTFAKILDSLEGQYVEIPEEIDNQDQFFSWLKGTK